MAQKTRNISLQEEQAFFLETFLEREMDDEYIYQMEQAESDPTHYEEILGIYKSVIGRKNNFVEAWSALDFIKIRTDQLAEIKNRSVAS